MIKKGLENQRKNLQQLELKNEKTLRISKNKILERAKGITLIALIITIIVLLILAGVSIATLTGKNGILTRANDSKKQTEIASVKEQAQLDIANWIAERLENGEDTTLDDATIKNIIETANASNTDKYYKELQSDKIITPSGYEILYSELYTNGNGETETGGLPSTDETQPFLPDGATVTNADLETGITIKDSNNNEWTWIVVPKSIYTTAQSSTDYANIEKDMQTYASKYRGSYTDEWYSKAQHGFASADEYNNHKNAMLKSVYENGGFYIGKYEVGIGEDTYRNYGTKYTTKHPIDETPVIQQDKYVYNWVRCSQAQELSESLAVGGKTSSLMFGIQWDLVLAYLEANGVSENDLKVNSGSWGNYSNEAFDITRGKYSTDNGANYTTVNGTYPKPASRVLLTTGATVRNSKMNIYDLAGNVWEWTLEKSTNTSSPCANRGGFCSIDGSDYPASTRFGTSTSYSSSNMGFRPALY